METYRVFISYSHQDRELAQKVVEALEANDFAVLWDKNLPYGMGFTEQIKNFIAHAHVFMPIISEESSERVWVHQEIGYAMAMNVPVLPVCKSKEQVPEGMLQHLHAIVLSEDPESLKRQMSRENFERLVIRAKQETRPLYECGELLEDRTIMMVDYATRVLGLSIGEEGVFAHVRQKATLSSFCIPDKPLSHPAWREQFREGEVSDYRCKWLGEERRVLEMHAREKGCSLIINPYLGFERFGVLTHIFRLKSLLEFLESGSVSNVVITIHKGMLQVHNVTIVGDWFLAEAMADTMGRGYRQTIFTRHAPSVRSRIELFEKELNHLLEVSGVKREDSRRVVIDEIKEILKNEVTQLLGDPERLGKVTQETRETTKKRLEQIQAEVQ
ncbi:MAG: toll/interleukin-1 receptor domain-containing protein [Thermodesulfobacteriota bacterium]